MISYATHRWRHSGTTVQLTHKFRAQLDRADSQVAYRDPERQKIYCTVHASMKKPESEVNETHVSAISLNSA